jgi:hypothetical protein
VEKWEEKQQVVVGKVDRLEGHKNNAENDV